MAAARNSERTTMDMALKRLSISVLLVAGMVALANPVQAGERGQREGFSSGAHIAKFERRQGDGGPQATPPRDNGQAAEPRKNGKMSPEERAALRRQINEAGQDIYVPKR
jgi:hypothetical protein